MLLTHDERDVIRCRFFVIANANATLHNLLMLVVGLARSKFGFKGLAPFAVPLLDLVSFDTNSLVLFDKISFRSRISYYWLESFIWF